jgi:hypothetical protein
MDMNYKFRHEMLSEEAWQMFASKMMLLINDMVDFCPDDGLREELETHRRSMRKALEKHRAALILRE